MSISDILSKLTKSSKSDDVPGTIEGYTSERCPACNVGVLKIYKSCCGSPNGYKGCRCGYKIQLTQ